MKIKAPAKVNIFLKITGTRNGYHELRSRFVRVDSLYDTLNFSRKRRPAPGIEIASSGAIPHYNTITKAYDLLRQVAPRVEKFFREFKVVLDKKIPQGAGLGGGSSDAAAFLNFCNEELKLGLSTEKLSLIGEKIGADVPFFIHGYASANVEGIGEFITPFEEEVPNLRLHTPPFHCDTGLVYRTFRDNHLHEIDADAAKEWLKIPSARLLEELVPLEANDLYRAALETYPALERHRVENAFFSGSGSTFFWPE